METQSVRPENPLLNYGELPAFDRIGASDVVPAMRWLQGLQDASAKRGRRLQGVSGVQTMAGLTEIAIHSV